MYDYNIIKMKKVWCVLSVLRPVVVIVEMNGPSLMCFHKESFELCLTDGYGPA